MESRVVWLCVPLKARGMGIEQLAILGMHEYDPMQNVSFAAHTFPQGLTLIFPAFIQSSTTLKVQVIELVIQLIVYLQKSLPAGHDSPQGVREDMPFSSNFATQASLWQCPE
jgi:hypothetical protein